MSTSRIHASLAVSPERQVAQAGGLGRPDTVLDAGVAAVTQLETGDVGIGLIGDERLEAVPVDIGEGELRARVRTFPTHDGPGPDGQACTSRSTSSAT